MYKNSACVLHLHIVYIVIWPWNEIKACISLLPFTKTRKIRFFLLPFYSYPHMYTTKHKHTPHRWIIHIWDTTIYRERPSSSSVWDPQKMFVCVCVSVLCVRWDTHLQISTQAHLYDLWWFYWSYHCTVPPVIIKSMMIVRETYISFIKILRGCERCVSKMSNLECKWNLCWHSTMIGVCFKGKCNRIYGMCLFLIRITVRKRNIHK